LVPVVPETSRNRPDFTITLAPAEAAGLGDFTPLWAGQNTSGCRAVPAAGLTRQLMDR
jgi:hypothetical protein